MGDSIKARKSTITKRRIIKKDSIAEDGNVEVVDVVGAEDIDLAAATEKRNKEVCVEKRTRTSPSKS